MVIAPRVGKLVALITFLLVSGLNVLARYILPGGYEFDADLIGRAIGLTVTPLALVSLVCFAVAKVRKRPFPSLSALVISTIFVTIMAVGSLSQYSARAADYRQFTAELLAAAPQTGEAWQKVLDSSPTRTAGFMRAVSKTFEQNIETLSPIFSQLDLDPLDKVFPFDDSSSSRDNTRTAIADQITLVDGMMPKITEILTKSESETARMPGDVLEGVRKAFLRGQLESLEKQTTYLRTKIDNARAILREEDAVIGFLASRHDHFKMKSGQPVFDRPADVTEYNAHMAGLRALLQHKRQLNQQFAQVPGSDRSAPEAK